MVKSQNIFSISFHLKLKQALKGFQPISASQNFLGFFLRIFGKLSGYSLGILWEFFGNFLGIPLGMHIGGSDLRFFLEILCEILLEFFWNSFGILLEFFKNFKMHTGTKL